MKKLWIVMIVLVLVCTAVTYGAEPKVVRITGQSWQITKLFLEDAAKQFSAAHPGVKVELKTYADPSTITNYAINWSRGNTPVDIVIIESPQFACQFITKNLLYSFDKDLKFFDNKTKRNDFVKFCLDDGVINNNQYVIPVISEVYAINVNKKMFKEAGLVDKNGNPLEPKSWEDIYNFAKQLHKVENGKVVQQGATIQWGMNMYATVMAVLRASRGDIYGADKVSMSFNNPEFRNILTVWKKGVDEGVFSKETFADYNAGRNSFSAGRVAMLIESGSRWFEAADNLGKNNVSVLPLPGSMNNGSYAFGSGVIIPRASKSPQLAVQFIKEQLLSSKLQTRTLNQYGKMPVIMSHYKEAMAPEWDSLKDIMDKSGATPKYRDFSKYMTEVAPIIQTYLDGKISLDETVNRLENLMKSLDKKTI